MEANWKISITDQTKIGEARRIASALAHSLSFNATDSGKVALVVTEIGTNIIRHAEKGEILLRALQDQSGTGIEVLGLDSSRGMGNIRLCLEDGFSTAGTSGNGLGAIRRQSDVFDLESVPSRGTGILSQIFRSQDAASRLKKAAFESGIVAVPHPHETTSGDHYFVQHDEARGTAMVVDGLGHGILAAEAARKACSILKETLNLPLETILTHIHSGLRGTRGAAVGLARIQLKSQELQYIGVGNIAGRIIFPDGSSKSLLSFSGIVGHEIRKLREMSYPWTDHATLVLHSDGLNTQWDVGLYPGILSARTSLLAGILYRDFNRGRDDVTVMAVKTKAGRSISA